MDNKPLDINDSDKSTEGGPPGWMAYGIIAGSAVLIAVLVILFSVLF